MGSAAARWGKGEFIGRNRRGCAEAAGRNLGLNLPGGTACWIPIWCGIPLQAPIVCDEGGPRHSDVGNGDILLKVERCTWRRGVCVRERSEMGG